MKLPVERRNIKRKVANSQELRALVRKNRYFNSFEFDMSRITKAYGLSDLKYAVNNEFD